MKYNFDELATRCNTYSVKWDYKPNTLPMWVADMDFKAPKEVIEALHKRVDIAAFGYSMIPDAFFEAIRDYFLKYHQVEFQKEWMIFTTGIIPAISSMVRSLTNVGDNVVLLSPVYNTFYNSIRNNKRTILTSDLIYENETFKIDYDDLEKKLALSNTSMLIFCNPHNPIGYIWDQETLDNIAALCKKHNVILLSDEIHCDLADPGYEYVPLFKNKENLENAVTLIAGGKIFNIAGLQSACIIIPNDDLRKKGERAFNNDEVAEPNFFAIEANVVAYSKCRDYVVELNQYIYQNKEYFKNYLKENLPHLKCVSGHATYLLWVDISNYHMPSEEFCEKLCLDTGLFVTEGVEYGLNGDSFFRINMATSLANVKDACLRLNSFIKKLEAKN